MTATAFEIGKPFPLPVSPQEGARMELWNVGNGRPGQYFSQACKQKAYRVRKRNQKKALRNP